MSAVPVSVAFQRLFCYHGADEGESEPYLWTIGFTLDGRTITHAEGSPTLDGRPAYFFSTGSHGSIGGSMAIGTTRAIPRAVGRFDTTLQPIILRAAGHIMEVPGWIGLIGVVLEEDSTSDTGAEAAHQAINTLVQTEIDEAVEDINLAGLAAEVGQQLAGGTSPADAARAIFEAKIDRLTSRIIRYARGTAVDAIVRNLSFPAVIVEGADPDGFMGVGVHVFSQQDLDATQHNDRLEFTDTLAEAGGHLESSDFVYNLHGEAWQRVEVIWTPVTDQVPPGRWQVTGIQRGGRTGKRFISHLGGQFPDGSPWVLPKGHVMDMLVARTHSFFVRSATGAEADVIIAEQPVNPLFPSLTTTPDSDPGNNLGTLPPCPVSVRHLRPVHD